MTLYEKLTTETVTAKKPSGEKVTGTFAYENNILYLLFDGNKKTYPFLVKDEDTYNAALLSASMMIEDYYEGCTEWTIPKDKYGY